MTGLEPLFLKLIHEAEKQEAKKRLEFDYAADRFTKSKAVYEASKEKTAALNIAFEELKKEDGAV